MNIWRTTKKIRLLWAVVVLSVGCLPVRASDAVWVGTTGAFTNAVNWSTGLVPGAGDAAAVSNGGTALFDGGTATNLSAVNLGTGASSARGALEVSDGTLSATALTVGGGGGSGTLRLSGGQVGVLGGAGALSLATASGSTGTVVMTGGTLTTENELWIGPTVGGTAGFQLNGGVVVCKSWGVVGRSSTNAYLFIDGGAWSNTVNNCFTIGSGGAGLVSVSNGTLYAQNQIYVGEGALGALTVSGGTVATPVLEIAKWVTGAVDVGGGALWMDSVYIGHGVGVFRLSGGSLGAFSVNAVWSLPVTLTNSPGTGAVTFYTGDQTGAARTNTFSNLISGNGALVVDAVSGQTLPGMVALGTNEVFTGGATLKGPNTLQLGTGGAAGWIACPLTIENGGNLAFCRSDVVTNSLSVSGSGGAVVQNGSGILVLTNAAPAFASAAINAGVMRFSDVAAIPGTGASVLINRGGSLACDGAYATVANWLNSGRISPASAGSLALSGSGDTAIDLTALGGGLYTNLSLGAVGDVVYSGALTPVSGVYRLGGSGGTLTYATPIADGRVVVDAGTGTVALNADNTFGGGVTVLNGTLKPQTRTALGTGPVVVSNGVLQVDTVVEAPGGVWIEGAGKLQIGDGGRLIGVVSNNVANYANTSLVAGGMVFNGSGKFTHTDAVGGSGVLAVVGGGTLGLSTPEQSISQKEVWVGNNGSTGNVEMSAGTLNVSSAFLVGRSGAAFTPLSAFTQSGGTVNKTGADAVYIGDINGSVGKLVLSNSAVFNVAAGEVRVGNGNGSGTLDIYGGFLNGTVGALKVAVGGGSSGTVNQYGGAVTNLCVDSVLVGYAATGMGVYNLQGGVVFCGGNLQVGLYGRGTMNQTGGTAISAGWPVIGRGVGGFGEYTLSGGVLCQTASANRALVGESGTGVFTVKKAGLADLAGGLVISGGGATGTVNLASGGTILTPLVGRYGGPSATMNFDGGRLQARGNNATLPSFLSGLTAANVKAGGVVIDSSNNTVTVAQNLASSSALLSRNLLRHRWSFNGELTDSVGGQTAALIGSVTSDGTQYTLAGGSRGTSYLSLGANILPSDSVTPVTIELWGTLRAVQNWGRIFDFGSDTGNYMTMSWVRNAVLASDLVEVKTAGISTAQNETMQPYVIGTEYHIAVVITPGAGTGGKTLFQWYKMDSAGNVLKSGSMSASFSLGNLTQSNMWLGHSQFSGDADASASYNEVRIWNAALTVEQLKENSLNGPDAVFFARDGGLTKLGSGTLVLSGANTYNGLTTISNGVLKVGGPLAIPAASEVRVAGGTYDLGGYAVTNAVVSVGSGVVCNGTLCGGVVEAASDSAVLRATFAGATNLVKTGTGTLTLAGPLSYGGNTIIEGGTLTLGSALRHRWSFNGGLTDSAGGQTAKIGGSGAVWSDTQVTLPGGAKGSAAYVDLGTNALPTNSAAVTLEFWATQRSVRNWSRIFDFGGGTANYVMMSWSIGTDLNTDRVELTPNGGTADTTMAPYALNTEYHIAAVIEPGAGEGGGTLLRWYKMDAAGTTLKSGAATVAWTLADLVQNNMWLGQSQFGDASANASYNEFRVWDAALSETQLAANSVLGPDALPSGIGAWRTDTALPTGTCVTVASNAVLNLNGTAQTVSGLSGSGLVTNGALTVAGVIAPGGTNAVGTLTLAATCTLTGTLLVDVATDGTCDCLCVQGSLDLSGPVLDIQNDSLLAKDQKYVIIRCTPGELTGRFASTTLDLSRWAIIYDNAKGEVGIIRRTGMAIMIK